MLYISKLVIIFISALLALKKYIIMLEYQYLIILCSCLALGYGGFAAKAVFQTSTGNQECKK